MKIRPFWLRCITSTDPAGDGGGDGEKQPQDDQPGHDSGPPAQEDTTDWKAEARKWENRAKTNKDKADQFDQLQQANKTEAEKQADRLAELETSAATATGKALRLEIALDLGLPKAWALRLQGDTEDELRADAKAILADLKQPTPPVASPPKERPGVPGSQAAPQETAPDPKKIAERVLERRR